MNYVEAPTEYGPVRPGRSLFLAGGISDCENWQARMTQMLRDTDWTVLNPRRRQFTMDDPAASTAQIAWEFRHLGMADAVLFWFPPQTLCPIALYELGRQSATGKPLFVGVHPGYRRRTDVQAQMKLARPEVRVVHAIEELARQVLQFTTDAAPLMRSAADDMRVA